MASVIVYYYRGHTHYTSKNRLVKLKSYKKILSKGGVWLNCVACFVKYKLRATWSDAFLRTVMLYCAGMGEKWSENLVEKIVRVM